MKLDSSTFWACSLLTSTAIFSVLIFQTSRKFLSDRTAVKIVSQEVAIGDVPFPALTICSDSWIYETVSNFGNITASLTDDE